MRGAIAAGDPLALAFALNERWQSPRVRAQVEESAALPPSVQAGRYRDLFRARLEKRAS